jgi:PKD domain
VATTAALLIPAGASWAAPVAAFDYSPSTPLTGEVVTFTSRSTGEIASEAWDLDGDGACDDASGPQAQRTFPIPGPYSVRLCVNAGESLQQQSVQVGDRAPVASIEHSPARPVAGQAVQLTSTSTDSDGPIASHAWGFGDDGVPDDASGVTATRTWATPGVYPVFLRVTDGFGLAGDAVAWIRVRRRPPELLSPFPVVRLVGEVTVGGAVVSALVVDATAGARVAVRCRGAQCPYKRAAARASSRVRFRRLQRSLAAGTVIAVSVTKRGTIGKYTRFRIRGGQRPARLDRCLMPGKRKPVRCPF